MKRVLHGLVALLALPAVVWAQSVKIEALRPQFDFGASAEPSTFTSAWFVTVAVPVLGNLNLVGQLPFAFGKLEGGTVPVTDETLGNPAVGLRFQHERLNIDVSLRLPLAKTGLAGFVGSIADFDRQEAFIPNIVPLNAMIRTKIDVSKFNIQPYGGVSFNIKTESEANSFDIFKEAYRKLRVNDGELHVLYGAEGWLEIQKLQVGATFSGRGWVSSGGNFSESTVHQIAFRAKLVFDHFIPGALFKLPFDDLILDNVFGVNAEIKF
ncbi:hypothetical protein HUU05_21380 [candidate division KSB1 bacterium]|nr:hypothetical protein [candidate division KSB1 bacterium]